MSVSRERWLAFRAAARAARRPSASIDSCELRARPDGRFEVTVRGSGLRSGAVPPEVRVGDRPVRQVRGEAGTVLRGVVDGGRPGEQVTVDLGPLGRVRATVGSVR